MFLLRNIKYGEFILFLLQVKTRFAPQTVEQSLFWVKTGKITQTHTHTHLREMKKSESWRLEASCPS